MRQFEQKSEKRSNDSYSVGMDQRKTKLVLKRSLDIVGALVFFFMFAGIYVMVWWLVLITTGGPAIFRHRRVGKNGQEFDCLKFRSMVVNSEEVLRELLASDPSARLEWETTYKLKNDPRVTRFGRFIRKTSLDELPQFWNVLRGDMSLVGPRPVVRRELTEQYRSHSSSYTSVRPGITGPWQVGGRSDIGYDERIAIDVEYVNKWTFWGDIKIIFQTVFVVVLRKGSY